MECLFQGLMFLKKSFDLVAHLCEKSYHPSLAQIGYPNMRNMRASYPTCAAFERAQLPLQSLSHCPINLHSLPQDISHTRREMKCSADGVWGNIMRSYSCPLPQYVFARLWETAICHDYHHKWLKYKNTRHSNPGETRQGWHTPKTQAGQTWGSHYQTCGIQSF